MEHGSGFGLGARQCTRRSFLTWTIGDTRELSVSYEYYYSQSSPAVEPGTSGPWHMNIVTVSLRWSREQF
jgi:hypothetical protein